MSHPPTEPPLTAPAPNLRRWFLFVAIMALLITILLVNDAALDSLLWRATRWFFGNQDRYNWDADHTAALATTNTAIPWYRTTPPPMGGRIFSHVERLVTTFRCFGEFWMTLILIAGVATFHAKKCRAALVVLIATAATGGVGALIAALTGRLRPSGKALADMLHNPQYPFLSGPADELRNDGYNHWQFLRGLHGGGDLAFPSGHATLAFATAAALIYFFPRGRALFLAVATGCALSRVILQAHFYSDALMGATLGLTLGTALTCATDRLLNRGTKVPQ